jgi:hypothetical protein
MWAKRQTLQDLAFFRWIMDTKPGSAEYHGILYRRKGDAKDNTWIEFLAIYEKEKEQMEKAALEEMEGEDVPEPTKDILASLGIRRTYPPPTTPATQPPSPEPTAEVVVGHQGGGDPTPEPAEDGPPPSDL